ncbi:hypothetical protein SCHPADRAFT_891318 [Schizopora paradoxa]|uniref:DUF6533 domain-containing protein n=1 Tax=Schizopora paradoxa TaxID=27342 RepID=A0A0H2S495_9AGAM|nr:hypothetical protein SCHPADRAFT_891318 [Schizopora paradoxa]
MLKSAPIQAQDDTLSTFYPSGPLRSLQVPLGIEIKLNQVRKQLFAFRDVHLIFISAKLSRFWLSGSAPPHCPCPRQNLDDPAVQHEILLLHLANELGVAGLLVANVARRASHRRTPTVQQLKSSIKMCQFTESAVHRPPYIFPDMNNTTLESTASDVNFRFIQTYVGFACYSILIYDFLLTLPDEVKFMWKRRRGLYPYLFFLVGVVNVSLDMIDESVVQNRYFFPLAFMIQVISYLSPYFTPEVCAHFVRYEGAIHCVGNGLAGFIMIQRTVSLYENDKTVAGILGAILVIQVSFISFFLASSQKAPEGCTLVFKESLGVLDALSYTPTLVFDTVVLLFTLFRVRGFRREFNEFADVSPESTSYGHTTASNYASITLIMLNQTLIYYVAISFINLPWVNSERVYTAVYPHDVHDYGESIRQHIYLLSKLIEFVKPGIRNVFGQLAEILTATMISRISIDIRKAGEIKDIISNYSNMPEQANQFIGSLLFTRAGDFDIEELATAEGQAADTGNRS